jgi:hypothetical protein
MESVTLGGVELKTGLDIPSRFSMLLWGPAKCGKTTLASTAPGKKLWINFDPDGLASLLGRDDIVIADYSSEKPYVIIPKLLNEDPLNISTYLKANPDVLTIVGDSITFLDRMALTEACKKKSLNLEEPGQRGYSVKNNYVRQIVGNLMRVAQEQNRNIIFTAHEAAPDKDKDGNVIGMGLALSDSLSVAFSAMPSEVWNVNDVNGKKTIAVRPCRLRSPMGSRMFNSAASPEFIWKYDPITRKGEGIADWFKQWQERGAKIPLPS